MSYGTAPTFGRRTLIAGGLASAAVGVVGCSTQRTPTPSNGSRTGGNDGVFTVNFVGNVTQYYRNWNPYSPADNIGSGGTYFYEPLIRLDHLHEFKPEPWLAKSWEVSPDYTKFTFHLRDDVTWADKKPFTSDDVIFTLNVAKNYGTKIVATDFGIAETEAPDAHTVTVTMKEPSLSNLGTIGTASIYPKHILASQDLTKWLNPTPIGTGPFTLESFSPQQVTLNVRDDYWGGAPSHVKTVKWALFANNDAGLALVEQDKIDMTTMAIRDAAKTFLNQHANNVYYDFSTGGGTGLVFNCAKAPYNDLNVRRALSKAIDFSRVLPLYSVDSSLGWVAAMDNDVWGDYIAPEFRGKRISSDPAAAKKFLAQSGWTVEKGRLTKAGKSYPMTLTTGGGAGTNWEAWADGIRQQLLTVLGITVTVETLSWDQWSSQLEQGDYDLSFDYIDNATTASSFFSDGDKGLNKKDIVPIGQTCSANVTRFNNDKASAILDRLATITDTPTVQKLVWELQRIYVDQVPYYVFDTSGNFVLMSGQKWKGIPSPAAQPNYRPLPYGGPDTVLMFKALEPSSNQ